MNSNLFALYESEVRSYCRSFPAVFNQAKGACLYDEQGNRYIDFLAGAGALNYGHNPEPIKAKIIEYLQSDCIIQGLDLHTSAKSEFIQAFQEKILRPRSLDYKMQFCNPTGTNAVEAALKLARKVTGRSGLFAFQGGFHGMTLGALSVTGNRFNRNGAGTVMAQDVTFMPYPHGFMSSFDTIAYIEHVLEDPNSGISIPAAMIVETIQAEGGVVIAGDSWLQRLQALCERYDILLIIDDIQAGCGRTGSFFSFEQAGLKPDMVLLSKSISGYGLPLSLLLLKPQLDAWSPGEHNGTFRGNQLAFVGARAAIDLWMNENMETIIQQRSDIIHGALEKLKERIPQIKIRGKGMIWGIDLAFLGNDRVEFLIGEFFDNGVIVENAGRHGCVIKLIPPLNIDIDLLTEGLETITGIIASEVEKAALMSSAK